MIAAISRIPVRLMPAYHADPWIVRGRLKKQNSKTTETTYASKPRRISKSTLRVLRIRPITKATAADRPPANKVGALRNHPARGLE